MVSSRSNITSLIDKLQKKGFVNRLPVSGDRRAYVVELTDEGRKRIEKIEPKYLEAVEKRS